MSDRTRDAIAETARKVYDYGQATGSPVSHETARRMTEEARETHDRKNPPKR